MIHSFNHFINLILYNNCFEFQTVQHTVNSVSESKKAAHTQCPVPCPLSSIGIRLIQSRSGLRYRMSEIRNADAGGIGIDADVQLCTVIIYVRDRSEWDVYRRDKGLGNG